MKRGKYLKDLNKRKGLRGTAGNAHACKPVQERAVIASPFNVISCF
ncbi:MAG: hypothetical protein LBR10_09065 [Prevotellaceae bacterium]|jgi:hypothetical protein|nr:hypothetical protein [Prevotellaceae bacterium]